MASSGGARLLALTLAPLAVGCGTTVTSSTALTVRDVSRVSVVRGDRVILPAGDEPVDALLGLRDVEPAPGSHARVAVSARRGATGAISFAWDTRLPLPDGEEQTLLSPQHASQPLDGLDVAGPVFRRALCVSLRRAGSGYRASAALRACGPQDLGAESLAIETPWPNVVVERRSEITSHAREQLMWVGGFLVLTPLVVLSSGATFDGAVVPVLATMGGLAAAGGLVMGTASLFPGARMCTETLRPDSLEQAAGKDDPPCQGRPTSAWVEERGR